MYELLEKASMASIMIIGIIMVIAPKKVGKKSLTETKKGVLIVRILGVLLAVSALFGLLLLSGVIRMY